MLIFSSGVRALVRFQDCQHVRQVVIKAVMFELHDKMLLHSSTSSLGSFFFGACAACVSATQEGDVAF